MYETKSQLRIISALLIVVIALAAGLIIYFPQSVQANTTPLPEEPPTATHERLRDAEISLEPALIYSQTFGGSGDEYVVDIFDHNDRLYIFGNTDSADLDFDESGAFLAILGSNGRTLSFNSYSGTVKAVTLYDGGYVMALQREAPVALAVDYDGKVIKETTLPITRDEDTLDIKYADAGYLFVTSLTAEISDITKLKMTVLDRNLEPLTTVVTNEAYSLNYVTILDVAGQYQLIANAISNLGNMLCYGEWGKKLAHYPLNFSYTVRDMWILNSMYFLSVTEKSTVLVKKDGPTIELTGRTQNNRIAGDEKCLYISADNSFFCVSGDKIIFSSEYGDTSFYTDKYVYAVSCKGNKTFVRSFSEGNKAFETQFNTAIASPKIYTCQYGMFVIGNTVGKFGGKDITLVKVSY